MVIVVMMFITGGVSSVFAAGDTVHIGAVLDFVSFSAPFDVPAEEGVRLAVDELNAAGGIGGKYKIKLSVKDYRGEAGPAVTGTKELLADKVDVILGSGSAQASIVVGGFAAKEVVVSTLGTAYSLGEVDPEEFGSLSAMLANAPGWNPLVAFSLIIFTIFYAPCFVTVVCIAREAGSWKWGAFSMIFNTTIAFVLSVAVYQIGSIIL